jgi:hypothetical protein
VVTRKLDPNFQRSEVRLEAGAHEDSECLLCAHVHIVPPHLPERHIVGTEECLLPPRGHNQQVTSLEVAYAHGVFYTLSGLIAPCAVERVNL